MAFSTKDLVDVVKYASAAFKRYAELVKSKSSLAADMYVDMLGLLNSYENVAASFVATQAGAFPKNIISQMKWLGKNVNLLNLLFNNDPFKDCRDEADRLRKKWNF